MGKIREEAEAAIKKYGKEAFLNHRDKVFDAIESICFCLEFLQNQEDWGSKRAIPLREDSFIRISDIDSVEIPLAEGERKFRTSY